MGRSLVSVLSTCIAATLAPASAMAFCGTYVGGADSELYNEVSQVAIVRQGTTTVLSISNDVHGDTDDFALVIPVPEVLEEDQVHVLDTELFDRLDQYSTPRLVSYECSDFEHEWDGGEDGGGEGGGWTDTASEGGGDVEVEAEYIVGEYSIVILSATESVALFTWLDNNNYSVPAESIDVLQAYLDGGNYFLAAKVDEAAKIGDGDTLSPLQFRYDVDMFGLPIRIGTLNAKETQDVLIYAITDYYDGRVGISNYSEVTVEDECLWEPEEDQTFADFYANEFEEAYQNTEGGVWMLEYAWGMGNCDPCTGDPPDETDLVTLGFDYTGHHHKAEFFFSRLHMRYAPEEATQDVVLYTSNITSSEQVRYIEYEYTLEDRFEICGLGWAEDPGSCDDGEDEGGSSRGGDGSAGGAGGVDTGPGGSSDSGSAPEDDDFGKGCQGDDGCSSTGPAGMGVLLWMLSLVALRRRVEGRGGRSASRSML